MEFFLGDYFFGAHVCAESIADTNTDTFAKSIGDTFTPILLPPSSCLGCKR